MALGAITGSVYNSEVTGNTPKVKQDSNYSNNGAANLSITEAQAALTTSESNPTDKQSGNEQDTEQKERPASAKQIQDAISKANSKMHHTRCEFAYHEETKRISIKVIDRDSDKVIREIPPEDTLEMLQKMWEMAGLLVDEKR